MLSPIGNGNALIFAGLFSWLASGPTLAQSPWQFASALDLEPGQNSVALVTQMGTDLAVRVMSGERVVHEFDGPDFTYGTEVVLLSNPGSASASFDLYVQPTVNGPELAYDLEFLADPTTDDLQVARVLTDASQAWHNNSDALQTLELLEPLATQATGSRLRQLAFLAYIDALANSGQGQTILATFASSQVPGDFSNSDRAYLDWHLAEALWEARLNDQAVATIENVSTRINDPAYLDALDPESRLWLELNVASTLGKCLIFAGINTGDDSYTLRAGGIFRDALARAESSNNLVLKGGLTSALSGYYDRLEGRNSIVRSNLLEQAAALFEEAGDKRRLITIRNNQAYAAVGRGDLSSALKLYTEALELQKTSKHLEGKAHVRARLAYVYYTLGDFKNAEIRFNESLELYAALGLELTAIHTELEYADLLFAQQQYDNAIALLLSIESKLNGQDSMQELLRTYTQLANNYLALNNPDQARVFASRAENLLQAESVSTNGSRPVGPQYFYILDYEILQASIAFAEGELDSAESLVNASLEQLQGNTDEPLQHLGLLFLKTRVQAARGDLIAMLETGDQALSLIDTVRASVDLQRFGPQWIARTNGIRTFLASRLLLSYEQTGNRAQLDKAFHLLQQVKATTLRIQRRLPSIAENATSISGLRGELQSKRQQLIAALLEQSDTVQIERELARLEEQLLLEQQGIEEQYSLETFSTIESVQSELSDTTLYRAFISHESQVFILDISKDRVSLKSIADAAEIYELTEKAATEIQQRTTRTPDSRSLAELLMSDIDTEMVDTVLVEPDSNFARVPFGYLFSLNYPQGGFSPINIPSISEYLTERGPVSHSAPVNQIVVLADPVLGNSNSPNAADGSSTAWWDTLGRLPYSRDEALSIETAFADHAPVLLLDESASLENLFSEISRSSRILHIATHGFASPDDPFFLGLALSGTGNENSGLVTTSQLADYRFSNELVVISACETGEGVALNGDGIMSLSRAFLASGASATISTLWPVSDRANAQFMHNFYIALREPGATAQTALRYAQTQFQNSATYRAPFYWGGFVLNVADASFEPVPAP